MMYFRRQLLTLLIGLMLVACGQATAVPTRNDTQSQAAIAPATARPAAPNTGRGACEQAVRAQFLDPTVIAFLNLPAGVDMKIGARSERVTGSFDVTEGGTAHHKSFACTATQGGDQTWLAEGVQFSNR